MSGGARRNFSEVGVWPSPVWRHVRDVEIGGSNPLTPTNFMDFLMNSYQKLCTEFYDIDKPQAPQEAIRFYMEFARQYPGPILEPMCGSGRFLIPFLKKGFQIEGTDPSDAMLKACRQQSQKHRVTPVLHQQSMQNMHLKNRYSMVFIPSGSFCLITDTSEAKMALRNTHEVMAPRSVFLVEIETVASRPHPTSQTFCKTVTRDDGCQIRLEGSSNWDPLNRIVSHSNRYQLLSENEVKEVEDEQLLLRLYDPHQFRGLLEDAGFRNIQMWKPHKKIKPSSRANSVIFQCHQSI